MISMESDRARVTADKAKFVCMIAVTILFIIIIGTLAYRIRYDNTASTVLEQSETTDINDNAMMITYEKVGDNKYDIIKQVYDSGEIKVYRNNKLVKTYEKTVHFNSFEQIKLETLLEAKETDIKISLKKIDDIEYKLNRNETVEFIQKQIANGSELLRFIQTDKYIDAYMREADNTIYRICCGGEIALYSSINTDDYKDIDGLIGSYT